MLIRSRKDAFYLQNICNNLWLYHTFYLHKIMNLNWSNKISKNSRKEPGSFHGSASGEENQDEKMEVDWSRHV